MWCLFYYYALPRSGCFIHAWPRSQLRYCPNLCQFFPQIFLASILCHCVTGALLLLFVFILVLLWYRCHFRAVNPPLQRLWKRIQRSWREMWTNAAIRPVRRMPVAAKTLKRIHQADVNTALGSVARRQVPLGSRASLPSKWPRVLITFPLCVFLFCFLPPLSSALSSFGFILCLSSPFPPLLRFSSVSLHLTFSSGKVLSREKWWEDTDR